MKLHQALLFVITIVKHVHAEQEVCVRRCNGHTLPAQWVTPSRFVHSTTCQSPGNSNQRNNLQSSGSNVLRGFPTSEVVQRMMATRGTRRPQKRSIGDMRRFHSYRCNSSMPYIMTLMNTFPRSDVRCNVTGGSVTCVIRKYNCHCNRKRLAMEAVTGVELNIEDAFEYRTIVQARLTNSTLTELEPDTFSRQTCRFGIYCNIFETHLLDASMVNATHVSFNFHLNVVRRRINEEISETVDTGDIGGFYLTVFYGLFDACTHGSC